MSRLVNFVSRSISLDLLKATERELALLKAIEYDSVGQTSTTSLNSIRRYECFGCLLRLLLYPDADLMPPLDVYWPWHCHMLNPEVYVKDCTSMLGDVIHHQHIDWSQRNAL
uniref:Uncharacterized protein n=1 Tax=Ditylenchus dipsaci TaxID=166011 RepID=A0A915EHL0_9BILA